MSAVAPISQAISEARDEAAFDVLKRLIEGRVVKRVDLHPDGQMILTVRPLAKTGDRFIALSSSPWASGSHVVVTELKAGCRILRDVAKLSGGRS